MTYTLEANRTYEAIKEMIEEAQKRNNDFKKKECLFVVDCVDAGVKTCTPCWREGK